MPLASPLIPTHTHTRVAAVVGRDSVWRGMVDHPPPSHGQMPPVPLLPAVPVRSGVCSSGVFLAAYSTSFTSPCAVPGGAVVPR